MRFRFTKTSKVLVGWVAVMTTGLMAHILARAQVVKNRSAVMRSRQRIRDASKADYEKRKAEQELAAAAAAAQ